MNVSIYVFVGLKGKVWRDYQQHRKDVIVRFSVFCAQSVFGAETKPDAGIILKSYDDIISKGYGKY